jgi:hypothetical protein
VCTRATSGSTGLSPAFLLHLSLLCGLCGHGGQNGDRPRENHARFRGTYSTAAELAHILGLQEDGKTIRQFER